MRLLIRWIISAATLLGIAYLLPGVAVSGFYIALITALLLGLVNAVIKPVLVFLTLPLTILSLGLFTFVINGLLFWFVSTFVRGFDVADFTSAFLGALILTVASWVVSALLDKDTLSR